MIVFEGRNHWSIARGAARELLRLGQPKLTFPEPVAVVVARPDQRANPHDPLRAFFGSLETAVGHGDLHLAMRSYRDLAEELVGIGHLTIPGKKSNVDHLRLEIRDRRVEAVLSVYAFDVVRTSYFAAAGLVQELVYREIGADVVLGRLTVVANRVNMRSSDVWISTLATDPYVQVAPVDPPRDLDEVVSLLSRGEVVGYRDKFVRGVGTIMRQVRTRVQDRDFRGALEVLDGCRAPDWKAATREHVLCLQMSSSES